MSAAPLSSATARPASLRAVLAVTFLGSVSGGAFWSGLFFVTARHYAFSPGRNLALAAAMGAAYALAAFATGGLLRSLERRFSPRAVLTGTLVMQAVAALCPLAFPHAEPVLWLTAITGVAASAMTWPVVESYLAAGRHGAGMRSAMGWFNVTWTPATALPLLVMPALVERNVLFTLALTAITNTAALVAVARLPRRPGPHDEETARAAIGAEYRWRARSAATLLPLSYVLSATLAPVLPHRLASVGVPATVASVAAATWMLARFATLAFLWRVRIWHGRWGTLALGAACLVGGVGTVLLSAHLVPLVAGLALFGVGMGITYYTSLYYTLAVGHAGVDAGGNFEGLIGLGYAIGPLLGLVGQGLAGRGAGAAQATVLLTWGVVGAAAWPAVRPWLEARRSRRMAVDG